MNNKFFNPRVLFILSIIIVAAVLRLLINIPNVTPIAAMALFGGAFLGKKHLTFIIPFVTLFITDLLIGLHSTIIYVYFAFALTVMIGIFIRKKVTIFSVVGGSLVSSILFFLITNFGSWATAMMPYPMNFAGLMQAYSAGIPFFRSELLGTLLFNGIFFGTFVLITRKYPILQKV